MSAALKNLAKIERIYPFTPAARTLQELRAAGRAKLTDAANPGLSLTSRFDLAYGAAFALSLSALHAAGYKPKDRVDAINCLEHTTALSLGHRRVIHRAHTMRNQV